jgi:hypothetical protein
MRPAPVETQRHLVTAIERFAKAYERSNRRMAILTVVIVVLTAFLAWDLWDRRGDNPSDQTTATTVAMVAVPNVVEIPNGDALSALRALGLKAEVTRRVIEDQPRGEVISQEPPAGTLVAVGATIRLLVNAS